MQIGTYVVLAGILAPVVIALMTAWRRPSCRVRAFGWNLLLGLAVSGAAISVLNALGAMPFHDWNGARIAPVFALKLGLPMYWDGNAPVQSALYGPVTYLLMTPAWIGQTPDQAVRIAGFVGIFFVFLPVLAYTWKSKLSLSGLAFPAWLLAVPMFSALLRADEVLRWYPDMIFSDHYSLGFGLVGLILLTRAHENGGKRNDWPAILLLVLAFYAKQTEIFLVPAAAVWLGLTVGFRVAWRFLLRVGIVAAAFFVVFGFLFGFHDWLQSTVAILARHPYEMHGLDLAENIRGQLSRWLLLSVPVLLLRWKVARSPVVDILLVSAIALAPISILGRVKFGGYNNTLHTEIVLLFALTVALVECVKNAGPRLQTRCAWLALIIATAGVHLYPPQIAPGGLTALFACESPQNQLAQLASALPGQFYFPWTPLAHYYGEGKLYDFSYGIYDIRSAGLPVPKRHFPPRLRFIAYPLSVPPLWQNELLPIAKRPVQVPGFKGVSFFAVQWTQTPIPCRK